MTINLPPTVENSLRDAVHSGQFASMDDAMTEAARLLLERLESLPAKKPGEARAVAVSKRAGSPGRIKARADTSSGKTVTFDDLHRQMLADGLLSQLPDASQDIDDDQDDEPVVIEGEPLSETIIRERR
jgi:Arc/MetJ-type ribon-helix-helix transcriptional regulator